MTKTINSFMPDAGEVAITISADNVTDHSEFTTAEDIEAGGVLLTVEPQTPETRTVRTPVLADADPVINISNKNEDTVVINIELIDDYFSGKTGEWGTDLLAITQILHAFYKSRKAIGGMTLSPAGTATGAISMALNGDIFVKGFTPPVIDAAAQQEARSKFVIECSGYTLAPNA